MVSLLVVGSIAILATTVLLLVAGATTQPRHPAIPPKPKQRRSPLTEFDRYDAERFHMDEWERRFNQELRK